MSPTNTFTVHKKHGIYPNMLRYYIYNHFYFPEPYKKYLELYKLDIVDTFHFLANLKEGTLEVNGVTYQVIYHDTDPTKLKRKQDYTKVKLSFRISAPEFDIIPTVLVKETKTT